MFALRPLAAAAAALLVSLDTPAHAGKTLVAIKAHGQLACGVSTGVIGFSAADSQGPWHGLDVDVCRAIAADVLGDPAKVSRWPAPCNGAPIITYPDSDLCWRFGDGNRICTVVYLLARHRYH